MRIFPEFVETYDEKQYSLACSGTPDECLRFFAEKGDLRNVKLAIRKDAKNWNSVLGG